MLNAISQKGKIELHFSYPALDHQKKKKKSKKYNIVLGEVELINGLAC